ncbi:NUDIX hydrolase [Nocardioides islandensis]|uniref:NUDIX hydrolase n=1 Tax=Nocardioides islandensis TaxID=433663 RepID=A0A930VCD7_9ACTN|nr:NUDIX hydrolase [Nocardioides islandensis]MBF4764929.1 NUDIX hydrolase [Nocardioides islandensis]
MTVPEQPTLTDGVVTLRRWTLEDVEEAVAGHDEVIAHWFGWPVDGVTPERMSQAIERWHTAYAEDRSEVAFAVEAEGKLVGSVDLRRRDDGVGELSWLLFQGQRGRGFATRAVRMLADFALSEDRQGGLGYWRVEAKVEPDNQASLRVATRSGLRREGLRRIEQGHGDRDETASYVVLARLVSDPPLSEPESFRSLLNSFLPRKRAIGQLLVRDTAGRVLLCQLTYKRDWDLPGGVVEVGESPRLAVGREIEEELALEIDAGGLVLTDWLPPWGGWDDAVCLVFDGGVHDASILDAMVTQPREIRTAEFCTLDQVEERCADFTARRIRAALAAVESGVPGYTESGR